MPVPMHAPEATHAVPVPRSFDEAYRGHAQDAARWARHLGGDQVDVEDVVQEVFLVVSRRLDSFRGDARFSTWLFEITRKVVANHRRRQRWRFWRAGEERKLASLPSPVRDPHAELERQRAAILFYRTLDQLPEKYRTVLVLFEIEGLSTHDIAELCHLPWSTVKVHLHRAREQFLRHHEMLTKKGKS